MTSIHFLDNQLAFSETLGANIGQLDLDRELCITIGAQSGRRGMNPTDGYEFRYTEIYATGLRLIQPASGGASSLQAVRC